MPTKRQQECFDFIREFKARNGYSPTVREIMAEMGIKSPNGVVCHLKPLQKKGLIEWTEEKARSITIVGESDGWIRTSERLPNNDSVVLVYVPKSPFPISAARYVEEDGKGYWMWEVMNPGPNGAGYSAKIHTIPDGLATHWMPLPKPPQEMEHCPKT